MPRVQPVPPEYKDRYLPLELEKGQIYSPALLGRDHIFRYSFKEAREMKVGRPSTYEDIIKLSKYSLEHYLATNDPIAKILQHEPFMFVEADTSVILNYYGDDAKNSPYACMKVIFKDVIGWVPIFMGTGNYCFSKAEDVLE